MNADEAAGVIRFALAEGNTVWVIGNGGSAAMASHFAAELIGDGHRCVALTDPAVITALGNDYGYDKTFWLQLQALATPGDVLVALSTSGESDNINKAIILARMSGVQVIEAEKGDDTQRVQEAHLRWLHNVWKAI